MKAAEPQRDLGKLSNVTDFAPETKGAQVLDLQASFLMEAHKGLVPSDPGGVRLSAHPKPCSSMWPECPFCVEMSL